MGVAVVYTRVSTGEQAKRNVANLPAQQKKCRDWCEHNGHSVLRAFVDKDSARSDDRESLQEMLSFCRQNRGKVTHVVIADLSRLARNVSDQATLITRLRQLGIKLHSVDEPTLDDTAAGRLSANILGCINQFYSDSLSERVRYRMQETIKSGRIVWRAPLGYRNVQNNGSKGLAVDPERAPLIRHAFELVSTGSHTSEAVLRMITAMGLRTQTGRTLSKQGFSKLMRNASYCGWVVSRDIKVRGITNL
jgi:site-specific DNA recombinase